LPSKQANLAIEGASLSFLGRIRARSSHNVSRFLGATVFTGVGHKVSHPALQPFSQKTSHANCCTTLTNRPLRPPVQWLYSAFSL